MAVSLTYNGPTTAQRLAAEFLGTFVLVFGRCGSAVLAAVFLTSDKTQLGIGFVGVALAFGLTVLTMVYAVGHISGGLTGCHKPGPGTTPAGTLAS